MRHGVAADDIDVAWVPGAFEIPLVADKLAALGPLRRGRRARRRDPRRHPALRVRRRPRSRKGVAKVSLDTGVPVMFGVITADTIEQAVERAGTKAGNKGWDAAEAAIEMANLSKSLG